MVCYIAAHQAEVIFTKKFMFPDKPITPDKTIKITLRERLIMYVEGPIISSMKKQY